MLNKVGVSRTECGLEVEEALIKELVSQGFDEGASRNVLAKYAIDNIIFEHILKEASIRIDEGEGK